ncbi:O-antigen ligase family protein [Candidatus Uhrbacteria bacterium]|nr:O-antigen ligase family protein [Candidatus Uhrbacteria bacterium]
MIQKFAHLLFLASILLLPWQTQAIYSMAHVSGEPSAYGVLSVYVTEAMIVFAFLLRGRLQTHPQTSRMARAVFFFLAAAFFSLGMSRVEWVGWFHLVHVVGAALLFFLLIDVRTNIRQVLILFLLGLIVPVLVGWFQVLHGSSPDSTLLGIAAKDVATAGVAVVETANGRLLRAYGTFPHPNVFGGYLALGIVGLAWLTRFIRSQQVLTGALVACVVLGSSLIVTFSRSAWLGVLVSCLVICVFMLWQRRLPPRRAFPVLVLGLVSVVFTLSFFHAQVLSRFDPSMRLEVISLEERASQYQTFGSVFWTAPLLGVGPSAYTFTLERLDPGHPVWSYQPIHNTYLLILAELGVFGMLVFGYAIFCLNPLANASLRNSSGLFAMALGVLLFVIGLFDHYLWTLWPGLSLTAVCLGTLVQIAYSSNRNENRPRSIP